MAAILADLPSFLLLPPSLSLLLFFSFLFSFYFSLTVASKFSARLPCKTLCKFCFDVGGTRVGFYLTAHSTYSRRRALLGGRTNTKSPPQKPPTQLSRSYSWIVWFTQVWTRLDASNRVKAPQIRYHIIPAFINISLLFFPVLCLFWKRKRRSQWRVITLAAPTSESTGLLTTEVANEDIRALTADRRLRLRRPTLLRCVVAMCR